MVILLISLWQSGLALVTSGASGLWELSNQGFQSHLLQCEKRKWNIFDFHDLERLTNIGMKMSEWLLHRCEF